MNYEILLNGQGIVSGNLVGTGAIAIISIAVLIGAIVAAGRRIIRKLRENDTLKYEFITIIAHKFRTPLTSTKWLLEGQISDETDHTKKESLIEMKNNTENLISMTGTLIEMTDTDNESKSSYEFDKTDLCDIVKSVADAHKSMFHEKNLFFSVRCEAEGVIVNADKPRLEFVLQTLMENAKSYTPPGRNVEVIVGKNGRFGTVSVIDSGIGIAPQDMRHIFTKFYRTKNAQQMDTEGFGVGLFLARSVIKRHKGRLEVSSPGIDQGTTFTLSLPLAR
ncbi:HAMP domain-containing histidine kinase [Patescibacteria group bacterium]|nr:HAMP domain-containing histidine kinase [Patescibacteria group bacterium]